MTFETGQVYATDYAPSLHFWYQNFMVYSLDVVTISFALSTCLGILVLLAIGDQSVVFDCFQVFVNSDTTFDIDTKTLMTSGCDGGCYSKKLSLS